MEGRQNFSGVIYRQASDADAPELKKLWAVSFGDPAAFIDAFFERLFAPENCVAAEINGKVISAMYALRGLSLYIPGRAPISAAYLYALCTDPACRRMGYGREVTRRLSALMYDGGEKLVATMPASEGLYGWYERALGAKAAFCAERRELTLAADTAKNRLTAQSENRLKLSRLTPEEYLAAREKILSDTPHIFFPINLLRFQEQTAKNTGGGLFAAGDGIAVIEKYAERLYIKELLTNGAEISPTVRLLMTALNAKRATVMYPAGIASPRRVKTAAILPGPYEGISIPPECYWGLTLD